VDFAAVACVSNENGLPSITTEISVHTFVDISLFQQTRALLNKTLEKASCAFTYVLAALPNNEKNGQLSPLIIIKQQTCHIHTVIIRTT